MAGEVQQQGAQHPAPWGVGPSRVPWPPEQTVGYLVSALAGQGAVVTFQSPQQVSGYLTVHKRPNLLVALVLFAFFVIPGVIYLIASTKTTSEPFAVSISPDGRGGATLVPSGAPTALWRAAAAIRQLSA